jgi:hypothetical protein
MKRRHNTSPTLSPALTSGDDQPRGNCADDYAPFDVLTEKTAGREYEFAKRAALDLCGACPIRQACWDNAHATDEPWFRSLRGKPTSPRVVLANRSNAGRHHQEQAAARLADLRVLIAAGAGLEEVCGQLGVQRNALYKWCRSNGHLDLWQQINPPKPRAITARRDPRRKAAA